jgi:glycosyltransferase involved in cell wall biosynthesis
MKLALVRTASNQLRYGSYNIQEIGLAVSLLNNGISTDIYARFLNLDSEMVIAQGNNCRVKIIPLDGIKIFKEIMYYPSLKKDLCSNDYDVVQLLDESQMMLPFLFKALKKKGIKTILWQGMYRDFSGKIAHLLQMVYDKIFVSTINKYSDIKIAKTKHASDYLFNKGYDLADVMPVGLSKVKSETDNNLHEVVKAFQAKYPKMLIYVGAIEPRRDIVFVLSLLNELKQYGYGLLLIGNGPDNELVDDYINEHSLDDQVLRYKNIPNENLSDLFKTAHCLVLPTKYEIYGMVILEALKNGVPVISTPEAGPYTILSKEEYGLCLDLNKRAWINAILMYENKYNSNENRNNRNEYVKQYYNWDTIGDQYYNKYLNKN